MSEENVVPQDESVDDILHDLLGRKPQEHEQAAFEVGMALEDQGIRKAVAMIKTSKRAKISARRQQVQKLRAQHLTLYDIAQVLGVHVNTVKKDVKVVEQENRQRVVKTEGFNVVADSISAFDALETEAWAQINHTDEGSAGRATYLNLILKARQERIALQREAGLIPRIPAGAIGQVLSEVSKLSDEELRKRREVLLRRLAGPVGPVPGEPAPGLAEEPGGTPVLRPVLEVPLGPLGRTEDSVEVLRDCRPSGVPVGAEGSVGVPEVLEGSLAPGAPEGSQDLEGPGGAPTVLPPGLPGASDSDPVRCELDPIGPEGSR